MNYQTREAVLNIQFHDDWFQAKWFYPVSYLAERVAVNIPIGWLNKIASRVPPLRWIYHRTMPLNLHDSWVVLSRKGSI